MADSALVYHARGPGFDPGRNQNMLVSSFGKDFPRESLLTEHSRKIHRSELKL